MSLRMCSKSLDSRCNLYLKRMYKDAGKNNSFSCEPHVHSSEFVLLPLFKALPVQQEEGQFSPTDRQREGVLQTLLMIIEKCSAFWVRHRQDIFYEILFRALERLHDASASEEEVYLSLQLLLLLIQRSSSDPNEELSLVNMENEKNKQRLAYFVKTVLDVLVRSSQNRQIQLKCLQILTQLYDWIQDESCAGVFFPGITTSLCAVILSDYKSSSAVRQEAMKLWGKIVVKILADNEHQHLLQPMSYTQPQTSSSITFQAWLQSTTEAPQVTPPTVQPENSNDVEHVIEISIRVHQVLSIVSKRCQISESYSIRRELALLCQAILLNCFRVLKLSISCKILTTHGPFAAGTLPYLLLDIVITSLEDEHESVRVCGQAAVESLELKFRSLENDPWSCIQSGKWISCTTYTYLAVVKVLRVIY